MITRDNIKEVVNSIDKKDIKRMKTTDKEYVILYLHITNSTSFVTVTLTNDYNRYKNVYKNGNCILPIEDNIFNN